MKFWLQVWKLASKFQILSNGYILAKAYKYISLLLILSRNQVRKTSLELKAYFFQFPLSLLSLIHTRVLVRDIIVKASFVYPSQKGELLLWEKSQILFTVDCIKRVGVTLEGWCDPCEVRRGFSTLWRRVVYSCV